MAKLSEINVLLKGYVVSHLPTPSTGSSADQVSTPHAARRRRENTLCRTEQGSTWAVPSKREQLRTTAADESGVEAASPKVSPAHPSQGLHFSSDSGTGSAQI